MSFCIGCLVSAAAGGSIWAFGKANEWHAERARRRAIEEVDRTTPCRGTSACEVDEGVEEPSALEPAPR